MGDVIQLLERMCELAKEGVRLPEMSRQKALDRATFGLALRDSRLQSADELLEVVDLVLKATSAEEPFSGAWPPADHALSRETLWRCLQMLVHASRGYRASVKAEADFKRTTEGMP